MAATDDLTNRVRLTWGASEGASYYYVYRNTSPSAPGTYIGYSTGTSFDDYGAAPGVQYYYWVRAGASDYSPRAAGVRALAAPGVAASDDLTEKVQVTWAAAAGATRYEIYRSTSATPPAGPPIGTTTDTFYDDTGAAAGTQYRYWVKSGNDAFASAFGAGDQGLRRLAAPGDVAATDTLADKVQVTWTPAAGATGYEIYRTTSAAPPAGDPLGTATGTSYDDTGAVAGTQYYYWLKAKNAVGASDLSGYNPGLRVGAAAVDLVVAAIDHSPAAPDPGDTVTFTVTVRNRGSAAAGPFNTGFWSDRAAEPASGDSPEQNKDLAGLAAGASDQLQFDVTASAAGDYRAWAYVDRLAAVGEGGYENNNAGPSGGHPWSVTGPTYVHATLAANQGNVAPGGFTKVPFDAEMADTRGEFDPATGTFTAKEAGTYLVQLGLELDDLDLNERLVAEIRQNGVACAGSLWHADRNDTVITGDAWTVLALAAGDEIEGFVFHNAADGPQTIRAMPWVYLKVRRLETGAVVHAELDAAQANVPAKAFTQIGFDRELEDTDGEFDPATGTFTAKTAGAYLVQLSVEMDDLDPDERLVPAIYVNGSVNSSSLWHADREDTVVIGNIGTVLQLAAGNTVSGFVFHNAADGAQTIRAMPWVFLKVVRLTGVNLTDAGRNASQVNLPANNYSPLRLNDETSDPLNEFNLPTGAFTAKNAGTYLVQFGAEVDDLDRNERLLPAIFVNGEINSGSLWHADGNDRVIVGNTVVLLHLDAGDILSGYIFHNARDGPQVVRAMPWCYLKVVGF